MSSNFRNHLRFEFERIKEIEERRGRVSAEREAHWLRDTDRRIAGEKKLRQLKAAEQTSEQEFRDAHKAHTDVSTRMGEIEEELFQSGEGFEDWPHQ